MHKRIVQYYNGVLWYLIIRGKGKYLGKGKVDMTIASCDKEVRGLIDSYSVVGLEAVLNSIVRATRGKAHMSKEDVFRYLESCYNLEEYWRLKEEEEKKVRESYE